MRAGAGIWTGQGPGRHIVASPLAGGHAPAMTDPVFDPDRSKALSKRLRAGGQSVCVGEAGARVPRIDRNRCSVQPGRDPRDAEGRL